MDLGPHAGFIWGAYGSAALIVGALIGWVVLDGRRQAARLADLERRGLSRRTADPVRAEPRP